ncbi:SRPBCC family protein [Kineosporia sp. J2-2]|uniref:SRPBCC family protein n=1 Tax=Kineosporia corallincola TaxID=2835133 RepID=A0ABS5TEY9_9ACTN|nr:SRPBCC family protein [Kineosporia corallincola]MBT0769615.1 SRPBCC family protein [Kineosporia corallincola]
MIEVKRQVKASPTQVFSVLADGWLYSGWVVGASRIRAVDDTWPAPGARIHHSVGVWPALLNDTTHVLECVPGQRLVLRAKGWPIGEGTVYLDLDPADGGCLVRMREDASAGPGKLVPAPVRQLSIAPRNTESLRRLALIAEGRVSS